jgi:hypothetical protein
VHEVPAGAEPDLAARLHVEMGQARCGNQAPVRDAAGEPRVLRTEEQAADGGVDAVGTDQYIDINCRPIGECQVYAVAAVLEIDEPVAQVQPLRGQRVRQRGQQIRSMQVKVREAVRLLHRLAERSAQQGAAVVPAALVHRQGPDGGGGERIGQAEPVQDP